MEKPAGKVQQTNIENKIYKPTKIITNIIQKGNWKKTKTINRPTES